jgi:hypothetical protein
MIGAAFVMLAVCLVTRERGFCPKYGVATMQVDVMAGMKTKVWNRGQDGHFLPRATQFSWLI